MKNVYLLDENHVVAKVYETTEFELTTGKILRTRDFGNIHFEVNPVGNPNSTAYVHMNDLKPK